MIAVRGRLGTTVTPAAASCPCGLAGADVRTLAASKKELYMLVTTTTAIDSQPVTEYVGVVTGEAVLGAHVFRDLFAGLRDIVGGRSAGYEGPFRQARETAAIGEMVAETEQMGAEAVIGVDVDYESIQIRQGGRMLLVSASVPSSSCSTP